MPKKRMALRMIKDVIRLKWGAELAHEKIATALKVSKGVVAKYVALASAAGLDWETVKDWDERQLVARHGALPVQQPRVQGLGRTWRAGAAESGDDRELTAAVHRLDEMRECLRQSPRDFA